MLNIEKVGFILTIPLVFQKYSQTYQNLLVIVNGDIYHHFCHLSYLFRHKDMCIWTFMVYWNFHCQQYFKDKCVLRFGKVDLKMVVRCWEKELLLLADITCILIIVDVGKMVKSHYETTTNVYLLWYVGVFIIDKFLRMNVI